MSTESIELPLIKDIRPAVESFMLIRVKFSCDMFATKLSVIGSSSPGCKYCDSNRIYDQTAWKHESKLCSSIQLEGQTLICGNRRKSHRLIINKSCSSPMQACLIFYNPVDSGALQLNSDNAEMTLGKIAGGSLQLRIISKCQFSTWHFLFDGSNYARTFLLLSWWDKSVRLINRRSEECHRLIAFEDESHTKTFPKPVSSFIF